MKTTFGGSPAVILETLLSLMLERSLAARSAGAVVNETAAFTVVFDGEARECESATFGGSR